MGQVLIQSLAQSLIICMQPNSTTVITHWLASKRNEKSDCEMIRAELSHGESLSSADVYKIQI